MRGQDDGSYIAGVVSWDGSVQSRRYPHPRRKNRRFCPLSAFCCKSWRRKGKADDGY